MLVPKILVVEREYLRYLAYTYAKVATVYYFQALSIYLRIKSHTPQEHYKLVLAMCFNIAIHFLGPQPLCKHLMIFRQKAKHQLFSKQEIQELYKKLLGYFPATHLQNWQLTRNIQWFIILNILHGRIQ